MTVEEESRKKQSGKDFAQPQQRRRRFEAGSMSSFEQTIVEAIQTSNCPAPAGSEDPDMQFLQILLPALKRLEPKCSVIKAVLVVVHRSYDRTEGQSIVLQLGACIKYIYPLGGISLSSHRELTKLKIHQLMFEAEFNWTTTQDYIQLNELQSRYPHRLVVLGFPCNQFGYQENSSDAEILNSLKYVRPDKLPYPDDDPMSLMQDPKYLVWNPISRNDISWNFEKFLIGPEGLQRHNIVYQKQSKQWIARPIYTKTTQTFRDDLMEEVIKRRLDPFIKYKDSSPRIQVPCLASNIGLLPKPSKEDVIEGHTSRFKT
ncbi:unnamed protein product [Leuciscus chuanchicus]